MKDHLFIMDAITEVDDDLIAQADSIRPKRRWPVLVAAAAALAVLISAFAVPSDSRTKPYIDTYVNNFITTPASPYEQGYVGNPYLEKMPSNLSLNTLGPNRMKMTVRAVEIMPDTYRMVGAQQGGFHLVRMEMIHQLNTECSERYFYWTMTASEAVDLTKYDALVIEGAFQHGYTGHVLYNVTQECLTAIDLPLIGSGSMFAFTDGEFDPSLWTTAETMQFYSETSHYGKYPICETPTLSEFEEYICYGNVGKITETIYSTIQPTDQKSAAALEYVRPFENGIFIPSVNTDVVYYNPQELLFRRYVNGYPTNEAIRIRQVIVPSNPATPTTFERITQVNVKEYGQKFTEEDIQNLPDLTAALEKVSQDFDAKLITPGHIIGWEEMKYISHSIFAWYDKTDDGVYGVIRVSWCYHGRIYDGSREDGRFVVCRDDQYFLVQPDTNALRPIEHEELTQMGGGAYHFMPGQYGYDEYGRKNPPVYVMY